uniref:Auxin-responsive protein n=1 Tax=Populus trichocarpa TaxID=3694 RepID=A9PCG9_POPTR|nr:unknown [Populus trichocarpa]
MEFERDLNLEATELRLGLPGTATEQLEKQTPNSNVTKSNKRSLPDMNEDSAGRRESSSVSSNDKKSHEQETAPPTKTQVVGWPPIRSYRKNCLQARKLEAEAAGLYVKVSMDGAPYLRKIDLKVYKGYPELLEVVEEMFNSKLVSILKGKAIMDPNMYQHMKIKMAIGCWLEMFHGKCSSIHARG